MLTIFSPNIDIAWETYSVINNCDYYVLPDYKKLKDDGNVVILYHLSKKTTKKAKTASRYWVPTCKYEETTRSSVQVDF